MDLSDSVYAHPAYQRLRRALSLSVRHDFHVVEVSPPAAARAMIETLRDDLALLRQRPISFDLVEWPPPDTTSDDVPRRAVEAVDQLLRARTAGEGTELLVLDTLHASPDDREALAASFSRLEAVRDELLRATRGELVLLAATGMGQLFAGAYVITLETPTEGDAAAAIEAFGTLLPEEQRTVDEVRAATRELASAPRSWPRWQLLDGRYRALHDVLSALQERAGLEAGAAVCVAALDAAELLVAIEPRLCKGMGFCAAWRLMLGQIALAQGDRRGAESQVVKAVRELRVDAVREHAGLQTSVELSRALVAFGDCQKLRGDFDEACALYEESIVLCRVVLEADPARPEWRRDLAAAIDRAGDLLKRRADLEGAQAAYEEALALYRSLHASDPMLLRWNSDVAISLDKLGALRREHDDLEGARSFYEESIALRRALLAHAPASLASRRGLACALDSLGDVRHDQGDGDGALALYEEALGLHRAVLASDPTRPAWCFSLAVTLYCVGDERFDRDELDEALAAYEESVAARRVLLASDPASCVWRHLLSSALNRAAEVRFERGDVEDARSLYEEALSVVDDLTRSFPRELGAQQTLAFTLTKLARLHRAQGDRTRALDAANRARAVLEALLATPDPLPTWERRARRVNALLAELTAEPIDAGNLDTREPR